VEARRQLLRRDVNTMENVDDQLTLYREEMKRGIPVCTPHSALRFCSSVLFFHTHSRSHAPSLSLFLPFALSLTHSRTHAYTRTHTCSLSLSESISLALSHLHTYPLAHSFTHIHTHTLSLSHTHMHTHTHTPTKPTLSLNHSLKSLASLSPVLLCEHRLPVPDGAHREGAVGLSGSW
jgi:hypothetical protein